MDNDVLLSPFAGSSGCRSTLLVLRWHKECRPSLKRMATRAATMASRSNGSRSRPRMALPVATRHLNTRQYNTDQTLAIAKRLHTHLRAHAVLNRLSRITLSTHHRLYRMSIIPRFV